VNLGVRLKATAPRPIIANFPDQYWGIGDGRGSNMLGLLLTYVRDVVIALGTNEDDEQFSRMFDNIVTILRN
jgi:hypothetical protein